MTQRDLADPMTQLDFNDPASVKAKPEGQNKKPEGFPGFRVPGVKPEGSGCRVSSAPGLGRGIISTATRIANPEAAELLTSTCVFCYYACDIDIWYRGKVTFV